ncbi:hypothetical protein CIPAW_09G129800 [Carya illinoinensis]|uniref:DUF4371 domain-containing protein n=1 Tax=Carya illinoinensis TaxID=32201 RepID=A0A8T1PKC1_CARIL|nr:hypothetical protein CIPAW_09G129800 [Carya illinoinensis]
MDQLGHIDKLVEKQVSQEMENNRLKLKTLIESHDESSDSKNQVNFIELIILFASYNDQVNGVVMENAPQNAKYISPKIQKEILHIFANKVQNAIHKKIRDAKFCTLVDEAQDESKREQIAIILGFVDKYDIMALTLKNDICVLLSRYDLQIKNIRVQEYDGGSNMCSEWNGLQTLFLKDCPYAYYVQCWAHKLQLALVTASREAKHVYQFFVHLTSIINIVVGSSKRHDKLQSTQAAEIERSHFQSACSLMRMSSDTCSVINTISNEGSNYSQRGDAEAAYMVLTSFKFILILNMMKKIMEITNALCQSLQQNFQDIVNVMSLVSTTKVLIQNLRDDGWESLLTDVKSFCEKHQIDILDMMTNILELKANLVVKLTRLAISKKSKIYYLIDRLIHLVLTLYVSTATTERVFFAMKLIKTRFCTRMEDEFIADY